MKISPCEDRLTVSTHCDRRAILRRIAASIAAPALAGSVNAIAKTPNNFVLAATETADAESRVTHRVVSVNGLKFHVAEAGQGPLVLLCHGFPECWYSWRHQLHALAEEGFHAVAPDMRGFGQTDAPEEIADYTIGHNVADMVQLVSALGEKRAVIVGHDWGAPVAWTSAQLRPDIFYAVAAMSVPHFGPRSPVPPLKGLTEAGITSFYWQYFQKPGLAEAEFERDVEKTVRSMLYGQGISLMMKPGDGFLTGATIPNELPHWLTEKDISYYAQTYRNSGYRGGLNWYRNIDRNWALSGAWESMTIRQPALFVAGSDDGVIKGFAAKALEQLPRVVPGLKKSLIIPDSGHWIQQERPREVNEALVEFLRSM